MKITVDPAVSVAPAAAGGVPVALPPVLVALATVMADPSQVSTGQVTAESSTKEPKAPHVYWVVAAAVPLPALLAHVKMIVFPIVSVAPGAPAVPPLAVPPVLAALASAMAVPSQVGAAVGQVTADSSTKTPVAPQVYWVVATAAPLPAL